MKTPFTGTSSAAILGQTLSMLRKEKGMTQEEMAQAMGISTSSWARIEKGDSDISVLQLRKAADTLGHADVDILGAAKAGEADARAKGLHVIAGAGAGSALVSLLAGAGGVAGGAALGATAGSAVPVIGTVLGGLVGAAIAAALSKGKNGKPSND